jgi:D-serine deaminase-like pyridoxal phosphate-dependent protein
MTSGQHVATPAGTIDWRTKGFWWPGPPVPFDEFVRGRHDLFGGAFTWPVLVARRSALQHNVRTLAGFCARNGLLFAPHAKTTMSPTLLDAQLAAGAWGFSAATPNQVLALRSLGVTRVLLANELLDPGPLRWIAAQVETGFEFLCEIDSVAGVRAIAAALATAPGEGPIPVLVELGFPGGRTGCRTLAELTEVATAAATAPRIELAGVAAYEGGLPDVAEVGEYLDGVVEATRELETAGLLPETVVVTAGGSLYVDVVADRLGGAWLPGHKLRTILRSGAYITHDDGFYRDRDPFSRIPDQGSLMAALELWAQVISTPEPGLAIAGAGKREASFDEGLPVPLMVRRRDGRLEPATGLRVTRLNDHHAFVEVDDGIRLDPGDLICFGISHPCTAFDKWTVIPVLDDEDTVVDLLRTYL